MMPIETYRGLPIDRSAYWDVNRAVFRDLYNAVDSTVDSTVVSTVYWAVFRVGDQNFDGGFQE